MKKEEGSSTGFILSLIGGIISLIIGLNIILQSIVHFMFTSFLGRAQGLSSYLLIILALYFLILGVWIITSGFWMKKNISLRKGAVTSLILGIISLNILAIIGGAIGLSKSKNK